MVQSTKTRKRVFLLLLALGLLVVGGCSRAIEMSLVCLDPDCNRSNAVRVRVYQLADHTSLLNTDRLGLWANEQRALGADLLRREADYQLFPGNDTTFSFKKVKKAVYVAVVADLARPALDDSWRVIYPVDQLCSRIGGCKSVNVRIAEDRLYVDLR